MRIAPRGAGVEQAVDRFDVQIATLAPTLLASHGHLARIARSPPPAVAGASMPYIEGVLPRFVKHMTMRWSRGVTIFKCATEPKTQIGVGFRDESYAGPGALGEAHIIGYADTIPSPGLSLVSQPTNAGEGMVIERREGCFRQGAAGADGCGPSRMTFGTAWTRAETGILGGILGGLRQPVSCHVSRNTKPMIARVFHVDTDDKIADTFDVMLQLRPELQRHEYVPLIRRLMSSDGLRLMALEDDGSIKAVAAYRIMTMIYCGRMLYIDDLVCEEAARSQGYGSRMIGALKNEARAQGCSEIQLISRVQREKAHRFYFREGFGIECFHFRARIE